MKIAFVTNLPTHYVTRLFRLLKEKCDVDFYFTGGYEQYWNKKNKLEQESVDGKFLGGLFLTPKLKISPGLFSLINRKYGAFIKTIDDRFALFFVFFAAKITRKPFILWAGLWQHPSTIFHRLTHALMKFIYRHSDAIVVYGEHIKRYLVDLGVPEERIFCAPHSVDNQVFCKPVSPDEVADLRKGLNLREGKILLYVGRLDECKGLEYLIEAAESLPESLNVIFIGSGPERAQLEQKCKTVRGKCLFLEHVPNKELYQYYALADLFVLPSVTTKSFKEPWGLVINEAMNQECPIVTTDAVGAAAGGLVEDGKNGYIVPECNSEALREALKKILDNDHLRLEMGRCSGTKISQWTPERTVTGFMQAIDFVLA